MAQKITNLQGAHFQAFLPTYQHGAGWCNRGKIAAKDGTVENFWSKRWKKFFIALPAYPNTQKGQAPGSVSTLH